MTDFRSLIGSIILVSTIMIMAYAGGGYIENSVDFITLEVKSSNQALGWLLAKV